jgi:hypothetical protein
MQKVDESDHDWVRLKENVLENAWGTELLVQVDMLYNGQGITDSLLVCTASAKHFQKVGSTVMDPKGRGSQRLEISSGHQ